MSEVVKNRRAVASRMQRPRPRDSGAFMSGDRFTGIIAESCPVAFEDDGGPWGGNVRVAEGQRFRLECCDLIWRLLQGCVGAEDLARPAPPGADGSADRPPDGKKDEPDLDAGVLRIAAWATTRRNEWVAKIAVFRAYMDHPAQSPHVVRVLFEVVCDELETLKEEPAFAAASFSLYGGKRRPK